MVIVTTVSVEQWGQMPKGVPKRMQLQRKAEKWSRGWKRT